MATVDLQKFLEDRLTVLDPTVDLSSGSPAQVQFIDPVIRYLGTDPLETDIKLFILDRFAQEYPDIFSGDPGVVSDTFIKPLILMLEPFKREIQSIKRNQSLKDPTLLSDDDADALVANVFDERTTGGMSGGIARVFFSNPTNVQVEITTQLYTANGLNFFPSTPTSITAEEMVFNRSGALFFMDFTVQAEKVGLEYNIPKNTLTGVQGILGAIKVDNPRDFIDGTTGIDTPSFIAKARGALTERSLVTRRGGTAILQQAFSGSLQAVQIIGAGDVEMQRDILSATSPGHAFLTGFVGLYKKMAYVQCRTIDAGASGTPVVSVGDQVYIYLKEGVYLGVSQEERFVRFTIDSVLIGPMHHPSGDFQVSYLVRVTEDPPDFPPLPDNINDGAFFEGGISKKGTVTVTSLPGVALANPITVDSQTVHVLGHADVYVRPVLQLTSTAVLNSLSADPGTPSLQSTTLATYSNNRVTDASTDFVSAGVQPGDFLVIESGGSVGSYIIKNVSGALSPTGELFLEASLNSTASSVRYRIIRDLTINPFNARTLKFPFGAIPNNDLQTIIGSSTFIFTGGSSDVLNYGVKVGDVIKVSGSTVDTGTFTITGFIDGQHVIVDRAAAGSESGLVYEIYTQLESVELPLVRLKELTVLDSAKQSTGVTIPPSEPVAVVPSGNITSAQIRSSSERRSGFVLPDLLRFFTGALPRGGNPNVFAAAPGRYGSGFEKILGVTGPIIFDNTTEDEFDYLPDMFDQCSYFVATAEDTTKAESFPPIDPKPGDALTLKSGPNKGDYLIKNVIKVRYTKAGPNTFVWAYVIQIYGKFPVDVLAELVNFIEQATPGTVPTYNYQVTELPIPSYLQTTLYSNFGTWLYGAISSYGATPPAASELQAAVDEMVLVDYDWGDPARGVLRTFFPHPTLFQQHTASHLNPTVYSLQTLTGELLKFRPDPNRYEKQEIVPPRLSGDADPLAYPRDDEELYVLNYTAMTVPFTVGALATASPSGEQGTIVANVAYGTSGTLVLRNVTGPFLATSVTDGSGGSASTTSLSQYPAMRFSSTSRASMFNVGVQAGDVVGVHEEFFLHTSTGTAYAAGFTSGKNYQSAVQTTFNSTKVTYLNSDTPFIQDMVGGLVFLEEGKDKGSYRVVKVLDSKNLLLDRPLTETTPAILLFGDIAKWGNDSGFPLTPNRIESTVGTFTSGHVNKYITIYGMDVKFQGSYKIKSVPAANIVEIDRPGFAEALPTIPFNGDDDGYWLITEAPIADPKKTGSPTAGTELVAARPFRVYRHSETEYPVSRVLTSPTESVVVFDQTATLDFCDKSPFRIFRRNIRRVTPFEMAAKPLGGLFYFDTEVVSMGANSVNNLGTQSYLSAVDGTFESFGYKHIVDDNTLTFSTKESGKLFIPSTLLPVNSPDSAENFISLVGTPLQISYEKGTIVQSVQDFLDSPVDRVTTANMLARHFIPSYVYYDALYIGGSSPGVIAKDIISFINNLAVEEAIDVSLLQQLIENRGGNIETPTAVFILIHDWDRKQWMEFSENRIGGSTTLVPYNGTPRVSFFVSGPDVSGQNPLPEGERINLVQV